MSIPDTALLIPLADLLGVSVTELLLCERTAQRDVLETDQVEDIVKTAITYSGQEDKRAYQIKDQWIVFYVLCLFAGCTGTFLNYITEQPCIEMLMIAILLCAVFGGYFCGFVKIKLPPFYDENSISLYYDGPLRMNIPGVRLNNRNWPHIVKTARIWCGVSMLILPVLNAAGSFLLKGWDTTGNYILLILFFCFLFVPIYVAGKKYE